MLDKKHAAFSGRLVIVGFGSIGQGVLPLLLRHIEHAARSDYDHHRRAARAGCRGRIRHPLHQTALTRENYRRVLEPALGRGDFLLNVSVDVSSVALIELCQKGALYLDTCIEPWPGGYTDPNLPPSRALELCLARKRAGAAPTLSAAARPRF